jgi:hypothetical protein
MRVCVTERETDNRDRESTMHHLHHHHHQRGEKGEGKTERARAQ